MTYSYRMAWSHPIANNKKPRPSWRKSGLIKLNFFEFVFIATTFFPRRLCAVTLAGLLALSTSVPPSHPDVSGQWLKDR